MPASLNISPLALLAPRPSIHPASAPRTPNRSPVASHLLLSPPSAHRNSTDSWNSSNYDFEDPNAVWKDDQVRLLSRTLDALPSHLITPFNGAVPPSNLLDKIARGILAAKGPNDWPHSIRATRIKLLELARRKAQEERRKAIIEEHSVPLSVLAWRGDAHRATTPDPAEVLQLRTNTPVHARRPLYRQSSMDFMDPDKSDRSESIARLSTRLQHHDRLLHHPYLRPAHIRHRSDNNRLSPSTPSSSTLISSRRSEVRKSTISATSSSSSSFGSPMSISAPLRPSSLRCASTLTLASASGALTDADPDVENPLKNADFHRNGGSSEAAMGTRAAVKVERAPLYNGGGNTAPAPSSAVFSQRKPKSTPAAVVGSQRRAIPSPSVGEIKSVPRTPPNEPRMLVSEKATTIQTGTHPKKFRKGHKLQLSVSSDEDEIIRSKTAKRIRTREPSLPTSAAQVQSSLLLSSALPRDKGRYDLARSSSAGIKTKASTSSSSSTDNDLSTASTETAATTVSISSTSHSKHKSPGIPIQTPPLTQSSLEAKKPARRNPARNPSMFGQELPCPQRTPASPSRIPVSSPVPLSPPVSSAASITNTPSTSPLSAFTRPRTLRRAARRISFGGTAPSGGPLSPAENPRRHDGEAPALGSAFQLA